MRHQKLIAAGLILYLCAASVWTAKFLLSRLSKEAFGIRTMGRAKGVPEAPVQITEFLDYQCGACRKAHAVLNDTFQKYPGQVYLEARFHPLPRHVHGLRSALYAFCADKQKRFWKWHDLLLEKQDEWAPLADAEKKFRGYAKTIGLNLPKLDACLEDPATAKSVQDEKMKNESMGVRMTPSFLVNKKLAVGSKALVDELESYFSTQAKGDVYDASAVYA